MPRKSLVKGLLLFLYLIVFFYIIIYFRFSLRFTYLFPLIFPLVLFQKKSLKTFLYDWAPFYLVLFLYDQFRYLADDLGQRVNYSLLANTERLLFAGYPTITFQKIFVNFTHGLLGSVLTIFYFGHFVIPVIVLYFLWLKNKKGFKFIATVFCVVSLISLFLFAVFPAAPPWVASLEGVIPPTERLLFYHMSKLYRTEIVYGVYTSLRSNIYAPFPSLHTAYPLIGWYASKQFFPRYQKLFLLNFLVVSFTLVLFAEHYVVDVFGGIVCTFVGIFVVKKLRQDV